MTDEYALTAQLDAANQEIHRLRLQLEARVCGSHCHIVAALERIERGSNEAYASTCDKLDALAEAGRRLAAQVAELLRHDTDPAMPAVGDPSYVMHSMPEPTLTDTIPAAAERHDHG